MADIASRRQTVFADSPGRISDQATAEEDGKFRAAVAALADVKAATAALESLDQGPGALARLVQPVVDVFSQATRTRWHQASRRSAAGATPGVEAAGPGKSPADRRKEAEEQLEKARQATRPSSKLGLVGLALSGGGIRSATFNLGVLQALAKRGLFEQFDYLSTVSGGGYIGGMMSSLLVDKDLRPGADDFPLRHARGTEESPEVKHLRSGANYLAPKGVLDKIRIPALFLRGLVVNLALLLPYLIWAVVVTELLYGASLRAGVELEAYYRPTLAAAALLLAWVFLFPPLRRLVPMSWAWRNHLERAFAFGFLAAIIVTGVNTLPLVVELFHVKDFNLNFVASGGLGTIVTFGAPLLPLVLASGTPRPLNTWQGKLMVYLLGLMGPVILVLMYVQLASWRVFCLEEGARNCPDWWLFLVGLVDRNVSREATLGIPPLDFALATVGAVLFLYGWLAVDVNLTSLHGFYRDRLSRAYLFHRTRRAPADPGEPSPPMNDRLRLSELAPADSCAPYHLVNATLNLQASLALQGRHADFFVFSKRFVGSTVTGYIPTAQLEELDKRLDLATAVAVSGAALAPNMGTSTNRALVFVMTLLNVRTGYWLPNPRLTKLGITTFQGVGPVYLLLELFGLVHEKSPYVNISDGGHVENLGLYELLRRRCRYIVVCDAEMDGDLTFDGLAKVMRYARIDGGVEIDISLDRLRKDAKGLSRAHYAVGRIRYPEGTEGVLVYIKATLRGDESEDIRAYRARSSAFPHEPTSQQFFDEGQFEAYRALGYHIADRVLDDGKLATTRFGKGLTVHAWVANLQAAQAAAASAVDWS